MKIEELEKEIAMILAAPEAKSTFQYLSTGIKGALNVVSTSMENDSVPIAETNSEGEKLKKKLTKKEVKSSIGLLSKGIKGVLNTVAVSTKQGTNIFSDNIEEALYDKRDRGVNRLVTRTIGGTVGGVTRIAGRLVSGTLKTVADFIPENDDISKDVWVLRDAEVANLIMNFNPPTEKDKIIEWLTWLNARISSIDVESKSSLALLRKQSEALNILAKISNSNQELSSREIGYLPSSDLKEIENESDN
ncbi:MAG: hypothetical protein K2K93_02440 [Muribaculaceae bacterium]|nr:hypothetical protein [Muribaculaceae bacterium]